MGGFFGVVSKKDCTYEVFFGTDYHSHLGTKRAGLTFYDKEKGLIEETSANEFCECWEEN